MLTITISTYQRAQFGSPHGHGKVVSMRRSRLLLAVQVALISLRLFTAHVQTDLPHQDLRQVLYSKDNGRWRIPDFFPKEPFLRQTYQRRQFECSHRPGPPVSVGSSCFALAVQVAQISLCVSTAHAENDLPHQGLVPGSHTNLNGRR